MVVIRHHPSFSRALPYNLVHRKGEALQKHFQAPFQVEKRKPSRLVVVDGFLVKVSAGNQTQKGLLARLAIFASEINTPELIEPNTLGSTVVVVQQGR